MAHSPRSDGMKRLAVPERDDPLGTSGAEAIRDEKRAGAKMRSEHRQPPGTVGKDGSGATRARGKRAENVRKAQYHTISVSSPLFRHPTPAFSPQIYLMTTPPRDIPKHFSCYSQKRPSLPRYASCFRHSQAKCGQHDVLPRRHRTRRSASATASADRAGLSRIPDAEERLAAQRELHALVTQ